MRTSYQKCQFNVVLPIELDKLLREIADVRGVKAVDIVREVMAKWVEQESNQLQDALAALRKARE